MPKRVQIQSWRKKGGKKPDNVVIVARPSKWGNKYRVGVDGNAAQCVAKFRADIEDALYGPVGLHMALIKTLLAELRGKDLACYCALDEPCHADVLLELANKPKEEPRDERNS